MFWLAIAVLLAVAGLPLFATAIFGRYLVCDADSHAECIRNWLTAMAGPLAIVAAFIAAVPVYEQLDEGRQATRAALAGLLKYEEDEKGGEMSALNEESERVVKNTTEIIDMISSISKGVLDDNDFKNMIVDIKLINNCIDQSRDLEGYLSSKKDGDHVLPSRRTLAQSLKDLAKLLISRSSSEVDDKALVNEMDVVRSKIESDLAKYKDEHEILDAEIVREQDMYRARREQITSELSQNP